MERQPQLINQLPKFKSNINPVQEAPPQPSLLNKYFDLNQLLYITIAPPAVLLLIYSILGGLALFMYLMGISTVIALQLWFFQYYFNHEAPQVEAAPSLRSSFVEAKEEEKNQTRVIQWFHVQSKLQKLQIPTQKIYESDACRKELEQKESEPLIVPFSPDNDVSLNLRIQKGSSSPAHRLEMSSLDISAELPAQKQAADKRSCSSKDFRMNEEGVKLMHELQNNPFTNLSPNKFQKSLGRQRDSEKLYERKKPECQCKLEKDNFKIIVKAKSDRIVSFLNNLEWFYTDLMQTEQDTGKSLSKLGTSKFRFTEALLWRDTFDDFTMLSQSRVAVKASFTFCKWKIVRRVFNEIGLSHVELGLFFKQGVLAHITALKDTVQNTVRQLQQKHVVMCEKLQQSEKNLMKVKEEYAKAQKLVEDAISNYTKGQQNIKDYQRILELEMKFKLQYKNLQDWVAKVSDASDSMFEARESFNCETLKMISEMRAMDRHKVEVFKSSFMSFIENHQEVELQIQTFIDECQKLSAQSRNAIESDGGLQKWDSEHSPEGKGLQDQEETLMQTIIERKRSLKVNMEEVKTFMNECQDEEDISFLRSAVSEPIPTHSIGPKNELLKINTLLADEDDIAPIDDNSSSNIEDVDEDENAAFDTPNRHELKFADFQFSPGLANIKSQESKASDEEEKKEFCLERVSTREAERIFTGNSRKIDEESKNTMSIVSGIKDLSGYIKAMKDMAHKYQQSHSAAIEKQYEEPKYQPGIQEGLPPKVLKLSKDNNEKVVKIWSHFISNFKSHLHQYEVLAGKLGDLHNDVEAFSKKQGEKKAKTIEGFKTEANNLKQAVAKVKKYVQQYHFIQQLMKTNDVSSLKESPMFKKQSYQDLTHLPFLENKSSAPIFELGDPSAVHERPQSQQASDPGASQLSNYNQYYKQMQNLQLYIKNPSPALMAYKGSLPTAEQCEASIKQAFDEMEVVKRKFEEVSEVCVKELAQVRRQVLEKVAVVKSELMMAHFERAKNSQSFFKNFLQCIEDSLNDIHEGSADLREEDSQEELDVIAQENQAIEQKWEHKPGCQYYEAENRKVASPSRRSLRQQESNLMLYKMDLEEEEKESVLLEPMEQRAKGRSSSVRVYSPKSGLFEEKTDVFSAGVSKNAAAYENSNNNNNKPSAEMMPSFQPDLVQQQSSTLPSDFPYWFNRALGVFYQEWKTSAVFQNFLRKELYISSNKGRSSMLEEIDILEVKLLGKAPELLRVQMLDSSPDDCLFDVDVSYRGTLEVLAQTQINVNFRSVSYFRLPLTVKVIVRSLNGRARLFFTNDRQKGCWYGFVGRPVLKLSVEPVIGKDNKFPVKQIPIAISFIEDMCQKKLNKYCLPNKRPISVPLTKSSGVVYPKEPARESRSPGVQIQVAPLN